MLKIEDGRLSFYQWDLNQRLVIDNPSIIEVHYTNAFTSPALVCEVYEEDGIRYANVPNILLQTDWTIKAYGCCNDYVIEAETFIINTREKPADYVYTETEIKTFSALEKRIEYLEQNGSGAVSSVNGKTGDVVLTAADVGAAEKGHTHNEYIGEAGVMDILKPYAKKTDIPSIDGLATENYVNQQIAAIPETDLTNYYTKKETDTAFAGKLNNTPGTWPVWTADEQAAARERMSVENGSDFELIVDATLEEEANVFKVVLPRRVRECIYHIWFYNYNDASVTAKTKCFDSTNAFYLLKNTANIADGRGYALNGYFRYNGPILYKSIVGYASDSAVASWTTDIQGNGNIAYTNYPAQVSLRNVEGLSFELDNKTHVLNVGAKIQVWGR